MKKLLLTCVTTAALRLSPTAAAISYVLYLLTCVTTAALLLPTVGQAQPPARQELQAVHARRSVDQELDHLTKDLQLTPEQRKQIRALLEEHHNKIQAVFDKNPTASRKALSGQIHAISDETHRQVHGLLNDHQKQLERAMQQRERNGEENRWPARSAPVDP
jgi:periplasmic protein CpxP/Spy